MVFDSSAVFNFGYRSQRTGVGERLLEQFKAEGELWIPPEVEREALQDPPANFDSERFVRAHFVVRTALLPATAESVFIGQSGHLDSGELGAMRLALAASRIVILDERSARKVAQRLGLPFKGTLGLLNEALIKGWLTEAEALGAVKEMHGRGARFPNPDQAQSWKEFWLSIDIQITRD
jgi:predicted nucleic acid-binding protein